jgi:hypothetical protein
MQLDVLAVIRPVSAEYWSQMGLFAMHAGFFFVQALT